MKNLAAPVKKHYNRKSDYPCMKIEWIGAVAFCSAKQGGFMKAKRFTTLLVSSVLAASMLVGCGGINKNETVATLDGQEIKLGVANFAVRLQQAQADDFYRAYFGDDVWSSDLYNNGTTMEDNTKNSVIEMIENLYILQNHCEGISYLSDNSE